MPDPRPALVDAIARAIADSDEYPGYWTDLTDAIGNSSPGADTRPLEACRAMYQREAMAALAAMTSQTPQDAPQQPATTQPVPECPPASIAPQNGARPLELWQVWADGYLAAKRGDAETTNPYAETCPTCGGYGMVMSWGGASDCPNDCWHGMVPKLTAGICDTAPIALDKIRARLDLHRRVAGGDVHWGLMDDLYAILDTAQEPR